MELKKFLFNRDDTLLLVIDIQEKLMKAIPAEPAAKVIRNTDILVRTAAQFNIPVVVSEQYRKGLGQTVPELMELFDESQVLEKMYFNCMLDEALKEKILSYGKSNIIITGIETHVCVFQTAMSLLDEGKNVILASDAAASRRKHDWRGALDALSSAGALIYPVETIAFIMLEKAGTPEFKQIAPLFK
jgi:nicotinamidase-related amidase